VNPLPGPPRLEERVGEQRKETGERPVPFQVLDGVAQSLLRGDLLGQDDLPGDPERLRFRDDVLARLGRHGGTSFRALRDNQDEFPPRRSRWKIPGEFRDFSGRGNAAALR